MATPRNPALAFPRRHDPLSDRIVLDILTKLGADHDGNGWFPVSAQQVAELGGVSIDTAGKAIRRLADRGAIERRFAPGQRQAIRLVPPNGKEARP